jgi:hypothetical protein
MCGTLTPATTPPSKRGEERVSVWRGDVWDSNATPPSRRGEEGVCVLRGDVRDSNATLSRL